MALWGAFSQHSHADYVSACDSALQQMDSLQELNTRWSKKLGNTIHVRMGIHGGKAII
jgi:class 3 adenylate cyclase